MSTPTEMGRLEMDARSLGPRKMKSAKAWRRSPYFRRRRYPPFWCGIARASSAPGELAPSLALLGFLSSILMGDAFREISFSSYRDDGNRGRHGFLVAPDAVDSGWQPFSPVVDLCWLIPALQTLARCSPSEWRLFSFSRNHPDAGKLRPAATVSPGRRQPRSGIGSARASQRCRGPALVVLTVTVSRNKVQGGLGKSAFGILLGALARGSWRRC